MNCPGCQNLVAAEASFCGSCGLSLEVPANDTQTLQSPVPQNTPLPADPFVGRVLDSKYELLELLGQGGMGAVYRARRRHIGDEVAIKLLLQKFLTGDEATERFRREARAAAMLRHPNVVAIHDFSDGRATKESPPYIVMELVEGTSLRNLFRDEGKISPDRAVSLFRGICAGVSAAHRRGIIHRDLKPDNIIIAAPDRAGESETVKVIDFGIVKLSETDMASTLTQPGTLIGTPFYMSPEQCLGEELDPRSDVYSLGAILYEMLGGRPPFSGTTPTAVLAKHLTDMPTPLDELGVASAFGVICQRALAKAPEQRYQTVDELYADLFRAAEAARSAPETRPQALRAAQSAQTLVATSWQPVMDRSTSAGPAGNMQTITAEGAPQIVTRSVDQPHQNAIEQQASGGDLSGRQLRRIRRFAVAGAVFGFLLSLGVGFLVRWLGLAGHIFAYDEFALLLITVASRDAIFWAFLATVLSGLRRSGQRTLLDRSEWPASFIRYGAAGAALAMAPFVILRTSLLLLPLGLAVLGVLVGLLVCGSRLLIHKFASSK